MLKVVQAACGLVRVQMLYEVMFNLLGGVVVLVYGIG